MAGRVLCCLALAAGAIATAGNNSWTVTGPPGGPVYALATHPTNPAIAVISTNSGLARSTDSGETWSVVDSTTLNAPQVIAFDPSSPNRVVAVSGQIYLSEDTGQTFLLAQGPELLGNVNHAAFGPDGTLYVTSYTGRAFKTSAPYSTWTQLTPAWTPGNAHLSAMAVDPDDADTLYIGVEGQGVYKSTNGGTSFGAASTTGFISPANIHFYEMAVDPADSTHVFAATSSGLYRSVNGGTSWTQTDSSPAVSIDFNSVNTNHLVAFRAGGILLSSNDSGATWTPGFDMRANGTPKARYVAGSATRKLYASALGAAVSGPLDSYGFRNTGFGGAIASRLVMANDGTVYLGMDVGSDSLYRRGSSTYPPVGTMFALQQATSGVRQVTALSVSATDANTIFLVNRGSELVRTANAGGTWTTPHPAFLSVPSDYITDVKIAPSNPQVAYVTRTETGVWKTTNGGTTFGRLNNSPLFVATIGVSPTNPSLVYAAGGADNGSGIFKSIDGGTTWTEQLPYQANSTLIYNGFVFHPTEPDTVYALAFGGVQKTTNGGASWSLMNFTPQTGTSAAASALLIDPVYPATMVMVNNAGQPGFSRSVDGGVTWAETSFAAPNVRDSLLYGAAMPTPGTIVAGTTATGVVEYTVAPDLSVSMPDVPAVLPLGVTYQTTITVRNLGPHASTASQLQIIRPSWLIPSVPANCASVGQTLTCQFGVLQPGDSVALPLSFTIAGTINGTQLTVLLSGHEPDANAANNRVDDEVTAAELIDLDMTLAAAPAAIDHDATTVVTASFTNSGPSPSTHTQLAFFLPGITLEEATPSSGACSVTGTFTCNFGTVAPGGTGSVTLRFRGNAVGTYPLTAMLSASGPDSDNAMNTAQLDIVVRPVADIGVTLAESADPVNVDAPLQYVATVRNHGGDGGITQLGVVITGAVVTGATATDGTCTTTAGAVSCAVNPLPVGNTTVTITLSTAVPGIATAAATAVFAGTDTQPANNTATLGTTIRRLADVRVTVADSADPVTLGDAFSYAVTVSNTGPNAGPVSIAIPVTGATIASVSSASATCTNTAALASCDIASLGTTASATITVNVASAATGTATATATATFQGVDSDTSNNSASADTVIRRVADIAVEITDSVDPVIAGASFTYTATVRNNGPNAGAVQLSVPVTNATVTAASATGGGTCTITAAAAQCDFAQVANGANATATVTVSAAATGTASATATATFAGTDPAAGNNSASASTTVTASPAPPAGGGSSSGGGGGGRFDWLGVLLLGGLLVRRTARG
jgi:hypothetical protein